MKLTLVLAICIATIAGTTTTPASAGPVDSQPSRAARFMTPSTYSPQCRADAQTRSACGLVRRFFRAVNSSRFESACAILGDALRHETHDLPCATFLALGAPEPMPWGILAARHAGTRVAVVVTLGQSELDRVRMRRHVALVGLEGSSLRILETRIVA